MNRACENGILTVFILVSLAASLAVAVPVSGDDDDVVGGDLFAESRVSEEDDGRELEEVPCEVDESSGLIRNGIGDNSMFLWPENKVPYTIDEKFNQTERENIQVRK